MPGSLGVQTTISKVRGRSRSTLVYPNAFPVCSDALSLDARRSKCVSYVLRCVLARRPSIKMRCVCAQMRCRSTPVHKNASPVRSDVYIPLVQFYLCQMDIYYYFRHAQMRSRSTHADPNCRKQLKAFVLSSEIKFDAFLEAILESSERKKYLFYRTKILAPPCNHPHPPPQRCRNKRFGVRISSFTERNEISQRWPQWRRYRGVFDFK